MSDVVEGVTACSTMCSMRSRGWWCSPEALRPTVLAVPLGRIAEGEEHLHQPDAVADPVVEPAVDVAVRAGGTGPGDDLDFPQGPGAVERNREQGGDVSADCQSSVVRPLDARAGRW